MKKKLLELNAISEKIDLKLFYSISISEYEIGFQGNYSKNKIELIKSIFNTKFELDKKLNMVISHVDNIRIVLCDVVSQEQIDSHFDKLKISL